LVSFGRPLSRTSRTASAPEALTESPTPSGVIEKARRTSAVCQPHRDRAEGRSKYSLARLIRLNFDLMTGFSLFPIQAISTFGLVTALAGGVFSVFLFVRRLIVGPEAEGLFTLFAVLFAFIGVQILALGIIGEYVGRIYNEVRKRPRFVIRNIYSKAEHPPLARSHS